MDWGRQFEYSNTNLKRIAVALWMVLALAIWKPHPIDALYRTAIWNRIVVKAPFVPKVWKDRARWRLINMGTPGSEAMLLQFVRESSGPSRVGLVMRLSKTKSDLAVEEFLNLASERDDDIRRISLQFLGKSGDRRAIPILIDAMFDENREHAREAVIGLGRMQVKDAVPSMVERLKNADAPDLLTNYEIDVASVAASLAGAHFEFRNRCWIPHGCLDMAYLRYKMNLRTHPERASELHKEKLASEIKEKREHCEGSALVKERKRFLIWWDKNKGKLNANRAG